MLRMAALDGHLLRNRDLAAARAKLAGDGAHDDLARCGVDAGLKGQAPPREQRGALCRFPGSASPRRRRRRRAHGGRSTPTRRRLRRRTSARDPPTTFVRACATGGPVGSRSPRFPFGHCSVGRGSGGWNSASRRVWTVATRSITSRRSPSGASNRLGTKRFVITGVSLGDRGTFSDREGERVLGGPAFARHPAEVREEQRSKTSHGEEARTAVGARPAIAQRFGSSPFAIRWLRPSKVSTERGPMDTGRRDGSKSR